MNRAQLARLVGTYGVLIALVALILFGWLRYENFLSPFNITTVVRYNSMFALVALGMCFVIMTGGIDLSVGSTAALGSVAAALASHYGIAPGIAAGIGAGLLVGAINGLLVTRANIMPFVATLCTLLAASGSALLLSGQTSVPVSSSSGFITIGTGMIWIVPLPTAIAIVAYGLGSLVLNYTATGRTVLAIGGNEDASRLMGLPVARVTFLVYLTSGALAGLAGVLLAALGYSGQPTEGVGWELFAIAAVVVGGTLLTGGSGSVVTTLAGVLLLGILFNVLNFENGKGWITLSAAWQSVVRGLFLLVVILLQARLTRGSRKSSS
jgi:ribose/xylose/arabinose/galactoside ABC-type transport system permease subunit